MKILCSIFVIYILYLLSIPCADKDFMCYHAHELSAAAENQDMPEQGDACSPFCVCSCCSAHVILSNLVLYSQPYTTFQVLDILNSPGSEKFFSPFIWQPPKIG